MWESMITTWSKGISSGDVVVVLQVASKPHPDLPNIPLASSFATTEEGRVLIKAGIQDPATTMRLYFLPPGTPKEVVQTIRKAFQDTMKDPEFLAEAKKSSFYVNPVAGTEVEEIINGLFNLNPSTLAKLKEILTPDK